MQFVIAKPAAAWPIINNVRNTTHTDTAAHKCVCVCVCECVPRAEHWRKEKKTDQLSAVLKDYTKVLTQLYTVEYLCACAFVYKNVRWMW